MSGSKRKTPITGITIASSEKMDKVNANRRYRRRIRCSINIGADLPNRRAVSNVWDFSKDGKQVFDPNKHPDLMRK